MSKITEIVLDRDTFKSDPVEAVCDFVYALSKRYVHDDELPPRALQANNLRRYVGEIRNGNIGQFVTNTRWKPVTVASIREGLKAAGAVEHASLFEDVIKGVEAAKRELEAALGAKGYGQEIATFWNTINKVRGDFYGEFDELPDLEEANAAWVASWSDVKLVSHKHLAKEIDRLASAIPDRQQRGRQVIEDRPWEWKRAEEAVNAAGFKLLTANAVDRFSDTGIEFHAWHVGTSSGHHRAVFVGGEALLYRGFTSTCVARVPAPEAPTARPPDGWEQRVGFKQDVPLPQRPLKVTPVVPSAASGPVAWLFLLLLAAAGVMAWIFPLIDVYLATGLLTASVCFAFYVGALLATAWRRDRVLRRDFAVLAGKPLRAVFVEPPYDLKDAAGRCMYHTPEPWALRDIVATLPHGRKAFGIGSIRGQFLAVTTVAHPSPTPMVLDDMASQLELTSDERQNLRDWARGY